MAILPYPVPEQNLFARAGASGAAAKGPDTVTYSITRVNNTTDKVTGAKFRELEAWVNTEKTRRTKQTYSAVTGKFVGLIEASDLNYLNGNGNGFPAGNPVPHATYTYRGPGGTPERPQLLTGYFSPAGAYNGDFYGVTKDELIYADDINNMITKIINAGTYCVCDCDYCTCNCDYCTCNCNYSCTCDCNY